MYSNFLKVAIRLSLITVIILLLTNNVISQNIQVTDSLLNELSLAQRSEEKVDILFELSAVFENSDPEKAYEYINQAFALSKQVGYKLGIGTAHRSLGSYYYKKGDNVNSHNNYDSAFVYLLELKESESLGFCYNAYGMLLMAEGNYDLAKENFENSLDCFERLEKENKKFNAYVSMGNLNFYMSNYNESLRYYNLALDIANETKDFQGVAMCLSNIGNVSASKGDYVIALDFYIRASHIYENIKDKMGLADCHNNIGLVHYFLGDFNKTVQYFNESVEIYTKLNYVSGLINSYINIGRVFIEQGLYDKAEENLKKALAISKEINDKYNTVVSNCHLGETYYHNKDYKKAKKCYLNALEINKEFDDALIDMNCFEGLAKIEIEKGNFNEAETLALESLKLSQELKAKFNMRDASKNLSNIYEKNSKYKLALKYYKMYKTTNDSIFNEENRMQINELETKFQTQKKQQQIELQETKLAQQTAELERSNLLKKTMVGGIFALLLVIFLVSYAYLTKRKDNAKISSQKAKIESQAEILKETNIVLQQQALSAQMNPHFMFNSLNSVQSYILKNDRVKSSEYLSKFSNLMRKVLENSQDSFITLQEEFEALNLYIDMELIRFRNNFNYNLNIAEGINLSEYNIPPLILQPFVENAIHHGLRNKEGEKELNIGVSEKTDSIFITIEDNGIGRKAAQKIKKKKLNTYKSYGTQITAKRIDLFKESYKNKIQHTVVDLRSDNGESTGTRIEINLY